MKIIFANRVESVIVYLDDMKFHIYQSLTGEFVITQFWSLYDTYDQSRIITVEELSSLGITLEEGA